MSLKAANFLRKLAAFNKASLRDNFLFAALAKSKKCSPIPAQAQGRTVRPSALGLAKGRVGMVLFWLSERPETILRRFWYRDHSTLKGI